MRVFAVLIRLIKEMMSGFLYYTYLLTLIEFIRDKIYGRRFVILCYHKVTDTKEGEVDYFRPQMAVSLETFRKQMEFLAKNYNVNSLEEVINTILQHKTLPRKTVAITFDDGYADNYTNAFPVLKDKKLSATIFLATDYIETNKLLWWDKVWQILKNIDDLSKIEIPEGICEEPFRLQLLKALTNNALNRNEIAVLVTSLVKGMDEEQKMALIKYMLDNYSVSQEEKSLMLSWNQVIEMSKNGISMQAHTKSHQNLTGISEEKAKMEIIESKREIETRINKKITCFSYPYGFFNDKIKQLVINAGLKCACSTVQGSNGLNDDLFALKRIDISENSSLGFRNRYSKAIFARLISH